MRVVDLSAADVDAVQRLLADDGGYARRVSGRPPSRQDAVDALTSHPPGTTPDAKHVLGILDDAGVLVGLADVIRGWPTADQAHLGLLAIAASRHRQGLGRALHAAVEERAETWPEIVRLRLGVVDTNRAAAEPFWRALGYAPTGESAPFVSGSVRTRARIWVRPVPRRETAGPRAAVGPSLRA
ncbi:GNAT family N-acetyltransferase [Isoptericola sediminis]|uniref:GNAT family N-acetyltransferase n=1 Tax=Isoptericola sediminis TaxID=2733572 RepID=A0A849JZU3_9MICO|nr:GNAT family N-acetyltransferase [Isoptericola sediminis]